MATEPFLEAVRTAITITTTKTEDPKCVPNKTRIYTNTTNTCIKTISNVIVNANIAARQCRRRLRCHCCCSRLRQRRCNNKVSIVSGSAYNNRCHQQQQQTSRHIIAASSCSSCHGISHYSHQSSKRVSSGGRSVNWLLLLSLLITCFIGDSLQIKNGKRLQ
ncbi:uncharacterized protein LOC128866543 [Anastrepha ludens]|uniref:uncharacterized protein LOC128866543 n=1 Tax=Anastrepha ludens TaxID=28586 RepID=UPI0023AFE24B|nr:uncharacterized protein LOC128866543 [Anastrepha ludens]